MTGEAAGGRSPDVTIREATLEDDLKSAAAG